MDSIDGLLNTIKQRNNITSDYKLALFLGIGEGNIANYRKKRSMPNAAACAKIAQALDMDPDVLTVQFEAQRAKDDETRSTWERIAARLQGGVVHSALLAVLVALGFITTPPNAHAVVTSPAAIAAVAQDGLYIMLSNRAIKSAAKKLGVSRHKVSGRPASTSEPTVPGAARSPQLSSSRLFPTSVNPVAGNLQPAFTSAWACPNRIDRC